MWTKDVLKGVEKKRTSKVRYAFAQCIKPGQW